MSDDLMTLGSGNGSSNEALKANSRFLRGTIAESLRDGRSYLDENDQQLLKFHGSYQQEDRDSRQVRKAAGLEKAYQFMVRSAIPGGVLTAEQYLAHDDIAGPYANGSLRFTTRQGIQLHGVLKGDLRATIGAINQSLISTLAACGDVNRNVMSCPAPARDPAGAQILEYARAIARRLAPRSSAYHEIWLEGEKLALEPAETNDVEPMYGNTYLPRKFKVAVAMPGDNCVDIYTQDIGFVPHVDGGKLLGFTVLIGGGLGSTNGKSETYPRLATPLCFVPPNDVLDIAETIVTIQRDYGDRKNRKHARMKYLVEERGIAWFRAETERRLGRRVADPHRVTFAGVDDHLGWNDGGSSGWSLGLHVESGRAADRVTALVRSALRDAVKRFRPGVRITPQQNVLLTGFGPEQRFDVDALFRSYGVELDPARLGIRRSALACPALPTCGQAVAEAERALPEVLQRIEALLSELSLSGEAISIRMTGCPNGCARPRMGDIGIVGRSLGIYDLYLGGDAASTRLNLLFAKAVKRDAIVETLRPPLERWKRERAENEALGDFVHRTGVDAIHGDPAWV